MFLDDIPVITCHLWTCNPIHGHVTAKSVKGRVVLNNEQTALWLKIDGRKTVANLGADSQVPLDFQDFLAELEKLGLISTKAKLRNIWS